MLIRTQDMTLSRSMLKYYGRLIGEYEDLKSGSPGRVKLITDFYKRHGLKRQNFLKIYHKYKDKGPSFALPQKRGPKFGSRRPARAIEEQVLSERERGLSRQEIRYVLKETLKDKTPSESGIYNILKRYDKNRLSVPQKRCTRMIIKEKAGELGHVDCYHLPQGMLVDDDKRYYVVALIDDASRAVWAGIVSNLKGLTVMFATLSCVSALTQRYGLRFLEIMTDNGAEFGKGPSAKNKDDHPFEAMLKHMKTKHRYTPPYKPQQNGKIERFWRTFREDFVDETVFQSLEEMEQSLYEYLLYYNKLRPHQALNGKTPEQAIETLPKA